MNVSLWIDNPACYLSLIKTCGQGTQLADRIVVHAQSRRYQNIHVSGEGEEIRWLQVLIHVYGAPA